MSRYGRRYRERYSYSYFPAAPSKGERICSAAKEVAKLRKQGQELSPVELEGFKIVTTFWGKAWCDNIEAYRDFAYRLERGRSYVRSNSVIDLQLKPRKITALVMGSELYKISATIKPVATECWASIKRECAGKIGSLIELLRGKLSNEVMAMITKHDAGLFPNPSEITFKCSCPDIAGVCKHVAAVLYGIGNRLDTQPELLFLMRGVDSSELITAATTTSLVPDAAPSADALADDDLAAIFGVEMDDTPASVPVPKKRGRPRKVKVAEAVEAPPVPKKRGRPRKVKVAEAVEAPPVPKKRGRPRKVAQ